MSFLGGYVGPGITAATQAVGGLEAGEANAAKLGQSQIAQQIQLLRQQHNDEITNALHQAQTGTANARTTALTTPPAKPKRTPVKFTVDGNDVQGSMDEAGTYYDAAGNEVKSPAAPFAPEKPGAPLPTTRGYVNRDGTPILGKDGKPLMPPSTMPNNVFVTGVGADGKPAIFAGHNKGDATLEDTGVGKPQAGGGQTSAQAALAMQRLGMSLADVKAAHARMTAMENDPEFRALLTPGNQAAMNAADVKPDIHAGGLTGALNNAGGSLVSGMAQTHIDPRLNTYRRDKETVGTALTEVLPRPNQQLLQIEKGLSGIDAGWNPDLTAAAQARRGQGVTQLEHALAALEQGRGATPNSSHAPTAPPTKAALSPMDRVRAAKDPGFAKWLKAQGYQP